MSMLSGPVWAVVVLTVLIVGAGLALLRYRALERSGSPLPPGAGGVRLRGLEAVVITPHVPGDRVGTVRVLGDEWRIAADLDDVLAVGDVVLVLDVRGTALVVGPVEATQDPTTDPGRDHASDPRRNT